MSRKVNAIGLAHIKQWEGLRLNAYHCSAGKLTIGYGHTTNAGTPIVTSNMKITEAEANKILTRDLLNFERAVEKLVQVPLNDNQFSTLVSFTYNVGISNFQSSTLLKKLNSGNYESVPSELMKWVKAKNPKTNKKETVLGLVNRRCAETGLWAKGSFVSSAYVETDALKQSSLLKPEILSSMVGAASGMSGFATGEGPAQWAFAMVMVGAFLFGAAYFIRRQKALLP